MCSNKYNYKYQKNTNTNTKGSHLGILGGRLAGMICPTQCAVTNTITNTKNRNTKIEIQKRVILESEVGVLLE